LSSCRRRHSRRGMQRANSYWTRTGMELTTEGGGCDDATASRRNRDSGTSHWLSSPASKASARLARSQRRFLEHSKCRTCIAVAAATAVAAGANVVFLCVKKLTLEPKRVASKFACMCRPAHAQAVGAHTNAGRQACRQAGRQAGRQADRQTDRHTGSGADKQKDRKTGGNAHTHARTHARTDGRPERSNAAAVTLAHTCAHTAARTHTRTPLCAQDHTCRRAAACATTNAAGLYGRRCPRTIGKEAEVCMTSGRTKTRMTHSMSHTKDNYVKNRTHNTGT
jgi:hypothetical protein